MMRRCGESKMTVEMEAQICRMSAVSIDRLLRPWKRKLVIQYWVSKVLVFMSGLPMAKSGFSE